MFEFFSIKKYYNEEENKLLEHYSNSTGINWHLIINICFMIFLISFTIVIALLARSVQACQLFFI